MPKSNTRDIINDHTMTLFKHEIIEIVDMHLLGFL